nr:hypothetical protein [Nocardia brasiliensis]
MRVVQWRDHVAKDGEQFGVVALLFGAHRAIPKPISDLLPVNAFRVEERVVLLEGLPEHVEGGRLLRVVAQGRQYGQAAQRAIAG